MITCDVSGVTRNTKRGEQKGQSYPSIENEIRSSLVRKVVEIPFLVPEPLGRVINSRILEKLNEESDCVYLEEV